MTNLRELLDLPELTGCVVLGDGRSPESRQIDQVCTVEPEGLLRVELRPGTLLVVVPGPRRWEHLVEVAVRRCAQAGAILALHLDAARLASSVDRIGHRLEVPVLALGDSRSLLETSLAIATAVRAPDLARMARIDRVLRPAGTAPRPPSELVALVGELLACDAAVLTSSQTIGSVDDELADRVRTAEPQQRLAAGDSVTVVHPLALHGETAAWLTASREQPGPGWERDALELLALVASEVLFWVIERRLADERESRTRLGLLAELRSRGETLGVELRERAEERDWVLSGWHAGVHILTAAGMRGRWELPLLQQWAEGAGVRVSGFVDGTDGFDLWMSTDAAPTPSQMRGLAAAVREDCRHARGRVAVGIGSPHPGIDGIGRTLTEAREAAIATTAEDGVQVAVAHELGASQLLLGWYGSGAFRDVARQVLEPLLELGEPVLVDTLEAYLERACSAAHTARVLGLHRNTVTQRINRAEKVLGVSLTQPDNRLALQLALRSRRGRTG